MMLIFSSFGKRCIDENCVWHFEWKHIRYLNLSLQQLQSGECFNDSTGVLLVWFLFYGPSTHFRSFGHSLLAWPHCSWENLLGSLPVLSAHSFASNWQLLFLNQQKRENGRRNFFITRSPRKNVPDVGIELGAACMPSGHASDWATTPGYRCTDIVIICYFPRQCVWSHS